MNELRGQSLLSVAGVAMAVLWVGRGLVAPLTDLPVLSQILQVLGLVYAIKLFPVAVPWLKKRVAAWAQD